MFDDMIAPLLNTKWGRRAAWGTLICLSLLLFVTIIYAIVSWRADYIISHHQKQAVNTPLADDQIANLIDQLPEHHIFGHFALDQGATLPVTSLQIRLVGVIQALPEKFSRVIVSESGKPGKVYQVGDTLTSGVKINAILKDGVILENGGRLEKLPLQRQPLLFQGMPKPLLNDEEKVREE